MKSSIQQAAMRQSQRGETQERQQQQGMMHLMVGNKGGEVLTPDSDGNIWYDAFKANLGEQKLLQNVVKEFLNFISRDIGWLSLEMIFYGGANLFT